MPLHAENPLPVRGLCVQAPSKRGLDRFVQFVDEQLAPRGLNTLVLRFDYNFEYESHPELRGRNPLSLDDVRKIVNVCREHEIQLIPQVNLLGHQSWAGSLGNLLRVYPQFDETPHVKMPQDYKWPNPDGLYCKSYCPLHPEVHTVVFDIVDEIVATCQATAFHAGMDEVFYIGDDKCPRCRDQDKGELFADEVTRIRDHLAKNDCKLWIWGDRLIDGKTTGLGMWEAATNGTHGAIGLIPKDVVICDWHYERASPTPVLFALNGFHVLTCPWNNPDVSMDHLEQMKWLRQHSNRKLAERFDGVLLTYWSGVDSLIDAYEGSEQASEGNRGAAESLKRLFPLAAEPDAPAQQDGQKN
ncbi:family 20 glycosylhydrolase [Blastopirellula marina]|uniref:family 20 glycosylhydrolase n=1 Tax=Blastopirellula marina TaxID=124 RepID=UPI0018EB2183|nr:family 20 glycosylhydrolase [Blastopirellula marina]